MKVSRVFIINVWGVAFLLGIGASFVLNRCPFCVEDFLNRAVFCLYLGNRAVHVFSSGYPPDFSGAPLWLLTRCWVSLLFGRVFCIFSYSERGCSLSPLADSGCFVGFALCVLWGCLCSWIFFA
jgi:hypothetical protein